MQTIVWKLGAAAVGLAAAAATRKITEFAWKKAAHREPPDDPLSSETPWSEALGWTLATAIGIAIARLIAERGAAAGWQRATGVRPPGHS